MFLSIDMDVRIHITAKDLQTAYGHTSGHASRTLKNVKEELGLKKTAKLTIKKYCEYVDIDLDEFLAQINVKLPNPTAK